MAQITCLAALARQDAPFEIPPSFYPILVESAQTLLDTSLYLSEEFLHLALALKHWGGGKEKRDFFFMFSTIPI